MEELQLPKFDFKLVEGENGLQIWDEFRKKYICLTPEEWVRQNFLKYLCVNLGYPKSLLKVESGTKYNQLAKRTDIVAFGSNGNPLLLVECKSYKISISKSVFEQAATYNKVVKAQFVVVTNGLLHFCCKQDFDSGNSTFLNSIPTYSG